MKKVDDWWNKSTKAIAQGVIKAVKAAIQTMAVATSEGSSGARNEATGTGPKFGWPALRQATFDWSATDKYAELRNFRLGVNNILQSYIVDNTEKIIIV